MLEGPKKAINSILKRRCAVLTGIHILLTYMCNLKCDHCFVYSRPDAKGTFGLNQIRRVLDEAIKIGTIKSIHFEGDAWKRFLLFILFHVHGSDREGDVNTFFLIALMESLNELVFN